MNTHILSWGRAHKFNQKTAYYDGPSSGTLNQKTKDMDVETALPYGMGRSYGDSNLNEDNGLLLTRRMSKILEFNKKTGIFRAEAGITIDEILRICVPHGWFVPVTPGTKFVTLGGAVANDIHGKNHHKSGSFGAHVTRFSLSRSNSKNPKICSPNTNSDLFYYSIGGLGLTGIIEWVEIQLKPIKSSYLYVENIRYKNLDHFFELSQESESWEYSVAWVDCFSKGKNKGRGIFSRAKFINHGALNPHVNEKKLNWIIPTPAFLLNKLTIKIFNWLYFWRFSATYKGNVHYDPFFYPLDKISNWNNLYGKKGFFQHQSIIPMADAKQGVGELLAAIEQSGQGSFLAVLKSHGPETSGGKMSFCMEGVSLALDFSNKGKKTIDLLNKLDEIALNHKGRLYIAKDGRMGKDFFQKTYPQWSELEKKRDPYISSSFWKRVT